MATAWRSPGLPGLFADWVIALRGHSGVYAIRDRFSGSVLYVGESHTGRLYETLTRHFQSRSSAYAGPTYDRGRCEVKVEICRRDEVEELQYSWILNLRPEDNILQPAELDDEEVPF